MATSRSVISPIFAYIGVEQISLDHYLRPFPVLSPSSSGNARKHSYQPIDLLVSRSK